MHRLRLHQSLVDQRGLRKFSHQYLREAVSDRYFQKDQVLKTHQTLATYFRSVPLSARKVEEYPYHLYKCCSVRENELDEGSIQDCKELSELMDCLTNLDLFEIFNLGDFRFDLHRYWQFIEDQFPERKDIVSRSYEAPLEKLAKELSKLDSKQAAAAGSASPALGPGGESKSKAEKDQKASWLSLAEKYEDVATFLFNTDRYRYGIIVIVMFVFAWHGLVLC